MSDHHEKITFITCPTCEGHGSVQNVPCTTCEGMAVLVPLHGHYLYWGRHVDSFTIALDHVKEYVDRFLNIILLGIGLVGIAVLLYVSYGFQFENLVLLSYWTTPSWEKLVFWITLISNLYLFYRLEQLYSPKSRVMRRAYSSSPDPSIMDWEFIRQQPASKFIDVSLSYAKDASQLMDDAWALAQAFNHSLVSRLHMFAVLPQTNDGALLWGRLGIQPEQFKTLMAKGLQQQVVDETVGTQFAPLVYRMLTAAYVLAYEDQQYKVTVLDVARAISDVANFDEAEHKVDSVLPLLEKQDIDYQKLDNVLTWLHIQHQLRERVALFRYRAQYRPKSGLDRAMTAVATPLLNQVSTDMTLTAQQGGYFPCIGRDAEFESLYRILEGRRAGVVLVGNHGVGRTTMLEGLAQRMAEESVPTPLQDKRLVSLSITQLVSGSTPAVAEERLMLIAQEVQQAKNIVLVIEDLHMFVGVSGQGNLDLSEVLAELIRKGIIWAIGSTSPEGWTTMERTSLGQLFQPVKVQELPINDAIKVLEVKSGPIEYREQVFFSYDSIAKAAELSVKYIHDKYLPEKALEIMDEAAIKVRKERGGHAMVTAEDIAAIISEKTGVVATKITESETEKLLHLEDEIHHRIIGQEEAVNMVAASLRRARAELRDQKRPIASLLFLGPTGVGKTELAKTVAEIYFGNEQNMVRFDMSEYQDPGSTVRLLGDGSRPGLLTEAIRQKPFTLVLFDEVEKANPDILNLFLQVMDDGRLTDASGRTVDFTNTVIVMTSNAGAQVIQDGIRAGTGIEAIKEQLLSDTLKSSFKPEFLNRFDGVVVFKPLTMTDVIKVARLMVQKAIDRLAEKRITLRVTDAAIAELSELGFDPKFGARPLRRVIQERLENALATYLLQGKLERTDVVVYDVGGKIGVEKVL